MLNLADPSAAFRWWRLPADGVGLARLEFIVAHQVKAHPMALLHPDRVDQHDRLRHRATHRGPPGPRPVLRRPTRLRCGPHRRISMARPGRRTDQRLQDQRVCALLGGRAFEPVEANPMIGWRGASRYYSDAYREGFALECRALRRVRDDMGLTNVIIMIPFCRTLEEADRVLAVMAEQGLRRGENSLKVYVMAEIPSNIILAEDFAERFDGFSIGSNDLTQLTLGVDRDSEALAHVFDETNPAVTRSIQILVPAPIPPAARSVSAASAPATTPPSRNSW